MLAAGVRTYRTTRNERQPFYSMAPLPPHTLPHPGISASTAWSADGTQRRRLRRAGRLRTSSTAALERPAHPARGTGRVDGLHQPEWQGRQHQHAGTQPAAGRDADFVVGMGDDTLWRHHSSRLGHGAGRYGPQCDEFTLTDRNPNGSDAVRLQTRDTPTWAPSPLSSGRSRDAHGHRPPGQSGLAPLGDVLSTTPYQPLPHNAD